MPSYDEPGLTWDHPLFRWDDPRTVQEILNPQHPPPMLDIVLDLKDLSTAELIARATAICAGVSSPAGVPTQAAAATAITALVATLSAKNTAQTTAQAAALNATDARDVAADAVTNALTKLAADLANTAGITEAQVTACALRLKGKGTPKPIPATPTGLELTAGDDDGELSGHCNGQPGIVEFYEIRFTLTDPNLPATTWQHADTSKKSSFDLHGLPSGQKIWVSARAVNARGKSGWSDPACKRVP